VLVFFGKVLRYKGVDLLLDAVAVLPADVTVQVVVVGQCREDDVRTDLEERAARAGARVHTRFSFVPDAELADYLRAADLAVFPFRSVTNSSSVATALGAGLPVIVPRLASLDDLPEDATVRYEPGPDGLIGALERAGALDAGEHAALRAAAARFAATRTWAGAAAATRQVYADVLDATAVVTEAPMPATREAAGSVSR
jgi:glycosyltransferase involved in cell wall biosynthesis